MESSDQVRQGLKSLLQGWASGVLATAAQRLQLLALEIQEEKLRIATFLFQVVAAAILLGAMVVFAALWVTVYFWDSHRLLAIAAGCSVCGLAGLWLVKQAARTLAQGSRLFTASLAESSRDRDTVAGEHRGS